MGKGRPPNIVDEERDKFLRDKDDCTTVRVAQTTLSTGPGQELPVSLFKPDPITVSLFKSLICEMTLVRKQLELITGEKIKGD